MSKHTPFEVLPGRGYGQLNGAAIRDQRGLIVAVAIGDVPEIDTDGIARLIVSAPTMKADIDEFMRRLGPRWFLEQGWFPASLTTEQEAEAPRV